MGAKEVKWGKLGGKRRKLGKGEKKGGKRGVGRAGDPVTH